MSVLWQDHIHVSRQEIPLDINKVITAPTLSIGMLIKKTKDVIIIVSDLERYSDRDDASYTLIYRSSILGIKEYGEITIDNLRFAP